VGALIGSLGFGMKALWSLPGAAVFLSLHYFDDRARADQEEAAAELTSPVNKALVP
jgi:hypothetical protein